MFGTDIVFMFSYTLTIQRADVEEQKGTMK